MIKLIESAVVTCLKNANIDGVGENVGVTVPATTPDEYIVVEKTGSDYENHIATATIAVQSYSKKSMLRAMEINEAVKEAMALLPYSADVFSVRLNSDYNFTDTTTREYRYQAVFNVAF